MQLVLLLIPVLVVILLLVFVVLVVFVGGEYVRQVRCLGVVLVGEYRKRLLETQSGLGCSAHTREYVAADIV